MNDLNGIKPILKKIDYYDDVSGYDIYIDIYWTINNSHKLAGMGRWTGIGIKNNRIYIFSIDLAINCEKDIMNALKGDIIAYMIEKFVDERYIMLIEEFKDVIDDSIYKPPV